MREDLGRELLTLEDSLPRQVACPFCQSHVPAWPSLLADLSRAAGEAERRPERRCPGCDSLVGLAGQPLAFSDPWGLRALHRWTRRLFSRWGCAPGCLAGVLCLAALRAGWRANPSEQEALALLLVLVVLLPVASYRPLRLALANRVFRRGWEAWLAAVGHGDADLGGRLVDCDERVRALIRQIRDREAQAQVLREARDKLERSSFRDRVDVYHRALGLVTAQIREREALLARFLEHRRDLDALVAVRRAEAAFDAGQPIADAEALDAERQRLEEAVERLLAEAEVEVSA